MGICAQGDIPGSGASLRRDCAGPLGPPEETVCGGQEAHPGTEQTLKRVRDLLEGEINSETRMEYNLQGRLSKITIETRVDGQIAKVVTQQYTYDDDGIKVTETETVDEDADGVVDAEKLTEYLNDKLNHTGYSQVLEQHLTEDGTERITTFKIGHDVLSQFSSAAENTVLTLLADGHGNARAVANGSAQILETYTYDAYGNAVGFDPAEALTNRLYSGEQYNPVSGLQYLRARWYRPQTGRFSRLDPFAGNLHDPQSLHKYVYVHLNPVIGVDPTGRSRTLLNVLVTTGIITGLNTLTFSGAYSALGGSWVKGGLLGSVAGLAHSTLYLSRTASLLPAMVTATLAGLTNAVFEGMSEFIKANALQRPYNRAAIARAFIDGYTWGIAGEAWGPYFNRLDEFAKPVVASLTSVSGDVLDWLTGGSQWDGMTTSRAMKEIGFNAIRAGLVAAASQGLFASNPEIAMMVQDEQVLQRSFELGALAIAAPLDALKDIIWELES